MGKVGLKASRWVARRCGRAVGCCLLLAAAFGMGSCEAAIAGPLISPGCMEGGEVATVQRVGDDLDVVLTDGRDILLPGIDPVRRGDGADAAAAAATAALSRWIVGRSVLVRPLAPQPDRWGRTVALLFAPAPSAAVGGLAGSARVSVVEALIDAGLVRARPDARTASCWPTDRAAEAAARDARLGLWIEPRYAVLTTDDLPALSRRTGTMVIVEGRIARVTEGRNRTYFGFDAAGGHGFAVTVERRVAARWTAAGTDLPAWRGRRVRVRGTLDDRFGLQIELTSLDQVEFIGE